MVEPVRCRSVEPRVAIADDAATLVGFNQAMALETEAKTLADGDVLPGVEAVLRDPRHGFYVVADTGREIAGALLVTYEWSDWRNGRFWWIQSVYVRPEHRRQGIYRILHAFVAIELAPAAMWSDCASTSSARMLSPSVPMPRWA